MGKQDLLLKLAESLRWGDVSIPEGLDRAYKSGYLAGYEAGLQVGLNASREEGEPYLNSPEVSHG